MNELFEFVTMVIPKAGIQVGALPLTLNMLLFGIAILLNLQYVVKFLFSNMYFFIAYYLLLMICLFSVFINLSDRTISTMTVAKTVVVLLSPLAGTLFYKDSADRALKIVSVASIMNGLYMVCQKIFGIINISIKGLTYTWGQDLAAKNIGYNGGDTNSLVGEANKMPSTYQNGNSVGLFLATALVLMLIWKPASKKWRKTKTVSVIFSVIGLLLCGSRSILFPMSVIGCVVMFNYLRNLSKTERARTLRFLFLFTIVVVLYFSFARTQVIGQLYNRYVTQTIANPTSNRSMIWSNALNYIFNLDNKGFVRFLLIGAPNTSISSEGMMGFMLNRGVIAQLLFLICLVVPILVLIGDRKKRIVGYGMFAVLVAFILDMSFYYLPCVMNYYIAFAIAQNYYKHPTIE